MSFHSRSVRPLKEPMPFSENERGCLLELASGDSASFARTNARCPGSLYSLEFKASRQVDAGSRRRLSTVAFRAHSGAGGAQLDNLAAGSRGSSVGMLTGWSTETSTSGDARFSVTRAGLPPIDCAGTAPMTEVSGRQPHSSGFAPPECEARKGRDAFSRIRGRLYSSWERASPWL